MMIDFKPNYSRNILARLIILSVVLFLVLILSSDFIQNMYFQNRLTQTGMVINGSIIALFLLGLGKVIQMLLRYMREEKSLKIFLRNISNKEFSAGDNLNKNSLILKRFQAIQKLGKQHAPINHNALASMLVANESTRTSFPRFINNILILTGVFGTIVSLSISLIGASNLLDSAQNMGNMNMIIHGMSTALSTTITAIVCYVFYGYFYMKLTDAQTHLLSAIEQITSLFLLPKYNHSPESLVHEIAELVRNLRQATESLQATQTEQAEASTRLRSAIENLDLSETDLAQDINQIKGLLREGFRLPAANEEKPEV